MTTRPVRSAALAVVLTATAMLPAGCAGLLGVAGDGPSPSPDATADGPSPLPDDTYERVIAQGVDPRLVHTIDLPGFELIEQSAGVVGNTDYAAFYGSASPPVSEAYFQVSAGGYTDESCATVPLWYGESTNVTTCEPDDTGWYRTGGDRHEYVVAADGYYLALGAPADTIDRQTLTAALVDATYQDGPAVVPSGSADGADGHDDTTSDPSSSPVERGDLPPIGDGAPMDPVGPGG